MGEVFLFEGGRPLPDRSGRPLPDLGVGDTLSARAWANISEPPAPRSQAGLWRAYHRWQADCASRAFWASFTGRPVVPDGGYRRPKRPKRPVDYS